MLAYVIVAILSIACSRLSNESSSHATPQQPTPHSSAKREPCKLQDGAADCKAACDAGSQQSCANLGILLLQDGDQQNAERLLTQACNAQIALGCGGLGSLHGLRKQWELAGQYLQKGCKMGDGLACESLGGLAQASDRAPRPADAEQGLRDAVPYYRRACDLGATRGCGWVAAAISDGLVAGTLQEALDLGTKACGGGDPMPIACRHAVELFERNTAESHELAARYDVERLTADLLSRGCKLGDSKSCDLLSKRQAR